jgi:DNA-binding NarL/FixJ family response regulator
VHDDGIVGRDGELRAVERFLEGGAMALVIDGEAGIGKTTIWRAAVGKAEASGWRVLAARPAEAEARLSYAALTDLVGPAMAEVQEELPAPQRRALEAALLLAESDAADARTVATAVLSLLSALAQRDRTLIAVDDVQWLDPASQRALAFAIRRLPAGTGLLVARRASGGEAPPLGLDPASVTTVTVGPLSLAALHHVIRDELGSAPGRALLGRIAAASGGNPFFALELARAMSASPAGAATGEPLPVPPTLQDALAGRLGGLSEAARDAALVAAMLSRPTARLVVTALDGDSSGLPEARSAGVLAEDGDRLRFSHPLIASAVLARVSAERRQALHRRLGDLVGDPEERARHLAGGAAEPHEATAATIADAAALAARRGAQDAAAELNEAAVRLTPSDLRDARAQRRIAQAEALLAVVELDAARAAARAARDEASAGPVRAAALQVLGQVAWLDGRESAVEHLGAALANSDGDRRLEGRIHARLAAAFPHSHRDAYDHAEAAARLLDEREDPGLLAHVVAAQFFYGVQTGRHPPDPDLLARALELERLGDCETVLSSFVMIWYHATDDLDAARARYAFEEARYRERGEEGWRATRAAHLTPAELRAGNVDRAEALAEAASATLESFGGHGAWSVGPRMRSWVDVHRGRIERARTTMATLAVRSEESGAEWFAALDREVLGLAELVVGDPRAACETYALMEANAERVGAIVPILRADPNHVEALLAVGERERARAVLERFEQRARAWPRLWTAVTLPRARALLLAEEGDRDAAVDALDAVPATEAARLPHDQGRALLLRGRLLRRANRKLDAADALRRALALFDRLGAPEWAEDAREELDRVGLRRRSPDELTASEQRIAELAASGLTNKQVAEAAFVSPKTVEANLGRVYRKLGIRSRAELGAHMAGRAREDGAQT